MSVDPSALASQLDVIEDIEKASTRMVCRAIQDFAIVARDQFALAKDLAGTVGEDVTRDAMETMGMSRVPTARLIGKIDYKRAAYFFAGEYSVRQALFVDSKAERGDRTSATIQISQTSMRVRMIRGGAKLDEPGQLDATPKAGDESYLATTIFVKYLYEVDARGNNCLTDIFVVCLPNGMLQNIYNPTVTDTIWRVGRNAPTRGEDFRVRINFPRLKAKRNWRVQTIRIHPEISFVWDD
jgi:hypothetical protein